VRYLWLIFTIPTLLFAQDLEFELDPDAFPLEIDDWQSFQPWAGGIEDATPELCDIDGDGDMDLFFGDERAFLTFFTNIGTSNNAIFTYITSFYENFQAPGASIESFRTDIDFKDIDGDGDFDGFLGGGYVSVFTNSGTVNQASFVLDPDTLRDSNSNFIPGSRIALIDINADGLYDLFCGTYYSGELYFYENIGTPEQYSFELVTEAWQGVQAPEGKADPCFGDLDSDGDLDLLVGTMSGNIYYYVNDGDSLNPQMRFESSNYFDIDVDWDASPELADIDADGDLDLFVGRGHETSVSGQGNISFYENIGSPVEANFIHRTDNYLLYDDGWHSRPLLVDIDADGDPDLFSKLYWELIFFRNTGNLENPYFTFESDFWEGIQVYGMYPWFCDIDQDGDYDLLAGESNILGIPQIYLYLNHGTPINPNYILYTDDLVPGIFDEGDVNPNISMADIDADGDEDLFVSTSGEDFHFFENISTSSQILFQHITQSWQNITDPSPGADMYSCFYDTDNDGDLDLFVSNESWGWEPWDKNLVFYRNHGDSINANMQIENPDVFAEFMIFHPTPFLIDMDQDEDGDMFLGDSWGGIRYFKNVTGEPPGVMPKATAPYRGPVLTLGPNPANPSTWISFTLTAPQEATLAVYNILGARVTTLTSGPQKPGEHTYYWNASQNASGVYIIRLETPKYWAAEKILVVK